MEPSLDGAAAGPASALAAQQQQHAQLDQNNHDPDDVDTAEFLKSIRALSEKRDREDLERYQKLEQEVARSRAERAQKKLERTRSVSPKKPHSSNDLPSLKSNKSANVTSTPPPLNPSIASPTTTMEGLQAGPPSPTKDIPEFKGFGSIKRASASSTTSASGEGKPAQSASSLARSGTLSWQRRPQSRGDSRPASMIGGQEKGHGKDTSTEQAEPSRDQIAASLGSRDPSYLRQTADRGVGSAAYRRSKDEPSTADLGNGRRGLPGLSQEKSHEYNKPTSPARPESVVSDTFSTPSQRDSGSASARFSGTSGSRSSKPDLKSLVAEDQAQQDASPSSDRHSSTAGDSTSLGRTPTMSSSQSRLANATERPSSPTKGMGGFVQSAMMKRSDSVNKRWSAQPNAAPSLSRQNSIASARSGYGGLQGSYSMPKLDPTINSRESSHEPSSRPTSSSSNNLSALAQLEGKDSEGFVKPALPRHHSRSKSVVSNYAVNTSEDTSTSPPSSPSKRFSPTKSSWIESALTKPDSPQPSTTAPARNSQPSWMANIAKAKAERASGDLTPRTSTPKPAEEVSRPTSPTKLSGNAPFGQGLLKRSESRDLQLPSRSGTPLSNLGRQGAVTPKPDAQEEIVASPPARNANAVAKDAAAGASSSLPDLQSNKEPNESLPAKMAAPESVKSPAPEPASAVSSATNAVSSPPTTKPKPSIAPSKPEIASKPQTDFRSTLRSRPAPETKPGETPEFLAKFGHLRKATTEKYVAPDTFGNNIKRGKAELAKTDGPVKTPRRDELKESLLAKKEDWKKAKEEGRELPGAVHERKVSGTPATPSKPEALARRDVLGRSESGRVAAASPEKPKQATPEALSRQKSLREKSKIEAPKLREVQDPIARPATAQPEPLALKGKSTTLPVPVDPPLESLSKQTSAPAAVPTETSRLAARFNPGLANLLARGPPSGSNTPSRSESPAVTERAPVSQASAAGETGKEGPLQDMRKGRAKGPKKRKVGAGEETKEEKVLETATITPASFEVSPAKPIEEEAAPVVPSASKPRAPPGSAASLMMASLRGRTEVQEPAGKVETSPMPVKSFVASSNPEQHKPLSKPNAPSTPAKSPALPAKPAQTPETAKKVDVPEFSGFGSMKKSQPTTQATDENKENTNSTLPSVRNVASFWTRQPAPAEKAEAPPQIKLPSRKDEEAALRSANLLSTSPSRPGSAKGGLGISVEKSVRDSGVATPPSSAGLPPKPAKPSRVVSGQLREASPNKGAHASTAAATSPQPTRPRTQAEEVLAEYFGSVPICDGTSMIDVDAVIAATKVSAGDELKTIRRSTQIVLSDGTLKALPQQEEYTVFSEEMYILGQTCTGPTGMKKTQVYIWSGTSAPPNTTSHAQNLARRLAREGGSLPVRTLVQGKEDTAFLSAIGGILITRRGAREGAKKQFMLCGRSHQGQIVFDELDFGLTSLCSGFAYLISYPVTLQQTKMYLWKGSAASTEEIGAARLVAMDLSETGEIIEVDDGAEFASFLKIFGEGTKKGDVPKSSTLFRRKAEDPGSADVRLWRIQEEEQKTGLFVGMFRRRPSWHSSGASSRSPSADGRESAASGPKIEARVMVPFTQADLEAEGLYVLDAYGVVFVLVGPLFASVVRQRRDRGFGQAVGFAREYQRRICGAGAGDKAVAAQVVLQGTPDCFKNVFRHWDEGRGLWGTAGLMAGSRNADARETGPVVISLDEVVEGVISSS